MSKTTLMRRLGLSAALVVGVAFGPTAFAAGLTSILMDRLGVSQPQAEGGAGAVFQYAKSKLTAANFAKVSSAVPDMQTYLSAAPAVQASAGEGGGALNALSGASGSYGGGLADKAKQALGGQTTLGGAAGGTLGAAQALAPAFQKLGLGSGMVGKFVPIIVNYVKSGAGSSTANILRGALGF